MMASLHNIWNLLPLRMFSVPGLLVACLTGCVSEIDQAQNEFHEKD